MEQGPLIQIGLPVSLFIIMLGMGLTLAPRDFRNVVVYPRATIMGAIAQILLLPVAAFGIVALLGLPGPIAVGLVIIAACPGGTTSNLFTFLARGNVALSIVLTVLASLVTILTLPLFTNLAMQLYMDTSERISLPVLRTVATLVVIILIPVSLGMAIRRVAPAFAKRSESLVSLFGMFVLVALIAAIVMQVRDEFWALLQTAGLAAAALNIAGILLGLLGGRLAGLPLRDALTVAIELGIKNATLGLLVTLTLLDSSEMSVPSAVYGVLMFVFGVGLIGAGRLIQRPAG
ncbi:bile acid:sodium symporter family protein [Salinisphaera sp.]|uniref:bile acid:sodium symporter family protein n=1 Tax=Salinisphaera sp. TaxID=1914330 RepID=UPI000C4A2B72|nr:bile acid:sodium symporter family protein [Salinisphaera sp.]MBS61607.1 bile acid:sodium symporter [Salinisphaera sp.]